jgi:hypothetical protein
LIPSEHVRFLKGCRDYFKAVRHVFAHAYYEPDRPLHEQAWGGLRWALCDAARLRDVRSLIS